MLPTQQLLAFCYSLLIRVGSSTQSSPRCPCASPEELHPLPSNASLSQSYGINCSAHDLGSTRYPDCTSGDPPEYCSAEWCFVKPGTCHLGGTAEHSPDLPGRQYSYETCGYANVFRAFFAHGIWKFIETHVAVMTNTAGWRGSYCTDHQACTGLTYDFMRHILDHVGGPVDYAVSFNRSFPTFQDNVDRIPPQVVSQFKLDHPNSDSAFSACVYATGMGFVDLCIGAFTITPSRRKVTHMLIMHGEPVHLVTVRQENGESLWQEMWSFTKPLNAAAWAGVFGSIAVLTLMMVWHNSHDGKKHDKDDCSSRMRKLADYALAGVASLVKGGVEIEASTRSSQITALGFAFLILITTSSYTANLAADLLADKNVRPTIASVQDAIATKSKMCIDYTSADILISLFPVLENSDLIVKKTKRGEALDAVGTSECAAALIPLEDLQQAQSLNQKCELAYVVTPVFYIDVGVPVSVRVQRSLQYEITKSLVNGDYQRLANQNKPANKCSGGNLAGKHLAHGLSMPSMLGTFVICLTLGILGVLARCCLTVKHEVDEEMRTHTMRTHASQAIHKVFRGHDEAKEMQSGAEPHEKTLSQTKPMLVQLLKKIEALEKRRNQT